MSISTFSILTDYHILLNIGLFLVLVSVDPEVAEDEQEPSCFMNNNHLDEIIDDQIRNLMAAMVCGN